MTLALAAVFVGWGLWLLLTADYQGGRHPAGALLVAIGAVAGIASGLDVRRRRRAARRRALR